MSSWESVDWEQIQTSFENREAIYIEKGALLVRVHNIKINESKRYISADVEEILRPGLGAGMFYRPVWSEAPLRRWNIGGDLTACSRDVWCMGYGGWQMYFAHSFVDGIVSLAARWPQELDHWERYRHVLNWLQEH